MAIPDIFVVVAPIQSLEGGLTYGGAIRIKVGDESAMLAFENAGTADNYRNAYGLTVARVILFSELVRISPASLRLPDQAVVFSSLEQLQSMQAMPEAFDFAKHLVRLTSS
jgi:hypothetical protein